LAALGTLLAGFKRVAHREPFWRIANKLVNAFTGPLFGIYLLAMFQPSRPTAVPVLIGRGRRIVSRVYYVAYRTSIGFHVALHVWPGRDAAGRVRGDRRAEEPKPTEAALQLTWREVDSFESGVESR